MSLFLALPIKTENIDKKKELDGHDKIREIVDDDRVDEHERKRCSLSHLFKELVSFLLLQSLVDENDSDLDEPQIEHLLQTAEAIRKDYPNEEDLGKVLLLPSFGELPQWVVVGDTFPVGCSFDESVHHKYFKENPDCSNPAYNTKYGVYVEGCGLNNVMMSLGHDDYMYLVAKENQTTLPSAALFIIRYHSFYALHRSEAYKHLMNEEDVENLKWLQIFNKYDLYSKSKVRINVEKVKPYYLSLIEKYFPSKLKW
ncbi:hypothetical protein F2P56_016416 [Juglans regia]|uniref:Inositol oxygenase n=1 Tax=Juglans regia TaxID=51240 RepID=A0A833XGE8_JUGRE|nr:hypothetical protein F2P56_016416 [Juglans regia]